MILCAFHLSLLCVRSNGIFASFNGDDELWMLCAYRTKSSFNQRSERQQRGKGGRNFAELASLK